MYDYRKYLVCQKTHPSFLTTDALTKNLSKSEKFILTSQNNRTVLSIPTNIAEGCRINSQKEFIRFSNIVSGSATELDYLFLAAGDLVISRNNDYINLVSACTNIRMRIFTPIPRSYSPIN